MVGGDYWALMLVLRVILGAVAAAIAASKGRSAVGWFFGGFFLFILGVIIVACLSNKKSDSAYRDRVEMENRRLREQVRQERMKTETFRTYTTARLDLHDQALGVDTRQALPPGAEPSAPQLEWDVAPGPPPAEAAATLWFYEQAGQTKGPVSGSDILRLLAYHDIRPDTLVWREGMAQWAPVKTVPLFEKAASA